MKIEQAQISGAYLISLEERKDERGSFSRQYCRKELASAGIMNDSLWIGLYPGMGDEKISYMIETIRAY